MAKRKWYSNAAKTKSTIVRPDIHLTVPEFRWLEKKSQDKDSEYGHGSINEVLYHLTKRAIDEAMLRDGEWTE